MQHKPRNALYLLPNAFTTGALFFGFYAIFQAISEHWQVAAGSIFIAAVLDALDGRVARLTNTASAFGVEYDSLSDVVAFGVAPAILLFQWSLHDLNKFGFAAAFFYCAATALRLARFNTQANISDRRYFIGIPCPAAAVFIASYVACVDHYNLIMSPYLAFILCLATGFIMVSKVRFYSFKTNNFLQVRKPLGVGLLLALFIAVPYIFFDDLIALLFVFMLSYILGSCGIALWGVIFRHRR